MRDLVHSRLAWRSRELSQLLFDAGRRGSPFDFSRSCGPAFSTQLFVLVNICFDELPRTDRERPAGLRALLPRATSSGTSTPRRRGAPPGGSLRASCGDARNVDGIQIQHRSERSLSAGRHQYGVIENNPVSWNHGAGPARACPDKPHASHS
jgi:hypothetical protein